jgi:hypothetical protein
MSVHPAVCFIFQTILYIRMKLYMGVLHQTFSVLFYFAACGLARTADGQITFYEISEK